MIRSRLVPAIAVAAVLALGACSSSSGTPEESDQQTGTSSQQSAGSTGDVSSSTSDEGGAAAGDSESSPAGDSGSSAPGSSGSESDGDATSISGTDAGGSSESPAPTTEESSTDSSSASKGSGSLDDQSAAWFSAACTGLKPTIDVAVAMMGATMAGAMGQNGGTSQAPDPKKLQQTIVQAMTKAGKSLTKMGGDLAVLPPPTIPHGEALAKQAINAMKAAGPKFEKSAQYLAGANIKSMSDFTAAVDKMEDIMDEGDDTESDLLDAVTGDPDSDSPVSKKTADAIKALPACSALNPLSGTPTAPTS